MIQPIIIWPYKEPRSAEHIASLIDFFHSTRADRLGTFVVAINHCSKRWITGRHLDNLRRLEDLHWTIRWIWSVDTCQTWLEALAASHQAQYQQVRTRHERTLYWLIPGDFHYATLAGQAALASMLRQLDVMAASDLGLSVGQISAPSSSFKEMIDTYGTWRLLGHWFPKETVWLRRLTTKPRSEFLILSDEFLEGSVCQRWLPYEQTLILLLRQIQLNALGQAKVYDLGTLQEDEPLKPYDEAVTQIERMERALKLHWRSVQSETGAWASQYAVLAWESHKLIDKSLAEIRQLLLRDAT
jgi:hypothetical protein